MSKEKVFVILVAYKNKQYIDACMESLLKQGISEKGIIVVDNASPYGEADYIEENWKDAHVVRLGANMGFSKANNEGMRYALALGADYCLLLNLDTVVCDGMLEELISVIPGGGNGIATARIYTTQSKQYRRFESEETIPWYTGGSIERETFIINQQVYDIMDTTVRDVEFASGCCMMIPRQVIEQAGFLEEGFFLYYEDVDYCLRLTKLGIAIRYNPRALLWHAEGGSQKQEKKSADYYWTRNRLLCIQRHMEVFGADPLELIREIIRNEDYFRGYNARKTISYEKKAIEDFMSGTAGQIGDHAYYFDDSFEKETRENHRGAAWATNVCGSVLLCNFSGREKYLLFEFGIDTEDSEDISTYTLYVDGRIYRRKCPSHIGYELILPFARQEQRKITVVKDKNNHVVRATDGIPLFFRLDNIGLREYSFVLETGASKIKNIGVTEQSRRRRWNWIQAEKAKIALENPFQLEEKYRIGFNTFSPSDQKRVSFSIGGASFEEEVGKEFRYELAVGGRKETYINFYGLDKGENDKYLSLIDFKWELIEGYSMSTGRRILPTSPYVHGFGDEEQEGDRYWNWIVKPRAEIIIRNADHLEKIMEVSFCTFSACDQKCYTLNVNGAQRECTVGEDMNLMYRLPADEELVLSFSNVGKPKTLEDGTELYLSVMNFKIEDLKAAEFRTTPTGKILLENHHCKSQRYRVCFNTSDIRDALEFRIPDREESFDIAPGQAFAYELMLDRDESMEAVFTAKDSVDLEDIWSRTGFLVAEIDSFTISADSRLEKQSNYVQGFGDQEREGGRYWNWIIRPQAKVIIHNSDAFTKVVRVSFCTFSPCDNKNFVLKTDNRQQICPVGEEIVFDCGLPANGETVFSFCDMGIPQILEDGQELYLSVINFNTDEIRAVQYQTDHEQRAVLIFEAMRCRISFNTFHVDQRLRFSIPDRGEAFDIEPEQSFSYEVLRAENESMKAVFEAEDCGDMRDWLRRINFQIGEIASFDASADSRLAKPSPYVQGFGVQEREEDRYWNWILEPQAKVIVHNTDPVAKGIRVSFSTFSACNNKNYTLKINERQRNCAVGEEMIIDCGLPANGELALSFHDMGDPQILENGEKLYLSILNFKSEELRTIPYQIVGDRRITWPDQSDGSVRCRVCLNTFGINKDIRFSLPGRGEEFAIEAGRSFIYEFMLENNKSTEAVFAYEGNLDVEDLLNGIDFLTEVIDSFEESADHRLARLSNYMQGFCEQERDEGSYWNWIVKPEARIIFHNVDHADKNLQISFNTYSPCDSKTFTIAIDGNETTAIVGEEIVEDMQVPANGEICFCFKDLGNPLALEDGRRLYLSVINFHARFSEV